MSLPDWSGQRRVCPWVEARETQDLQPEELHLWWVPLSATSEITDKLEAFLSTGELARANRYRFDRHRRGYILGRGTLRMLLAQYLEVPAREINFEFGPFGKPTLANGAEATHLCFNYSDAGDHALYGFTWNAEIGVDLENLDRDVNFERIVQRKFTRAEASAILGLPAAKRKAAFLACWTRKEGYGKAEGWGIRYSLDSAEICTDCETDRFDLKAGSDKAKHWIIQQIYPGKRFVGCVVYPSVLEARTDFALRYFTASPGLPRS